MLSTGTGYVTLTVSPPLRYGIDPDITVQLSGAAFSFTNGNTVILTAAAGSSSVTKQAPFTVLGGVPPRVYLISASASSPSVSSIPVIPAASVQMNVGDVARYTVTFVPVMTLSYAPILGLQYVLNVTLSVPTALGVSYYFPISYTHNTILSYLFCNSFLLLMLLCVCVGVFHHLQSQ